MGDRAYSSEALAGVPRLSTSLLSESPGKSVFGQATWWRSATVRASKAWLATSLEPLETNVDRPLNLFGEPLPLPRVPAPPREKIPIGDREWLKRIRPKVSSFQYSFPPASAAEIEFRHAKYLDQRKEISAAYVRLNYNVVKQSNHENCGSGCWIEKSESTGRLRVSGNYCKHRFCVACGTSRSKTICRNLLAHLANRESRFITLTLKHKDEELRPQIKKLLKHFRNLRQSQLWKEHVTGGVAFVEVKRSASGKRWHPHLHIICEGKWLDSGRLSAQWLATTGDSKIIDIRYVTDANKVASYVVKYASKPLDATLFANNHWLDEAIQALHGVRLCNTFGTWRGVKLEDKGIDPKDWVAVTKVTDLLKALKDQQSWAIALWDDLNNQTANTHTDEHNTANPITETQ